MERLLPQGSILFSLYMFLLGDFIHQHNIAFHCYVDAILLHIPVTAKIRSIFNSRDAESIIITVHAFMFPTFITVIVSLHVSTQKS